MVYIDQHQKSILIILLSVLTLCLTGCAGTPPINLGIQNKALAPCPSSPNCVSSYAKNKDQQIEAWAFEGTAQRAQENLVKLLNSKRHVTVIENKPYSKSTPGYIRCEFKSSLFGFVDDIELVIEHQTIHIRSASRLGHYDFGANRKRIEQLKSEFATCCF